MNVYVLTCEYDSDYECLGVYLSCNEAQCAAWDWFNANTRIHMTTPLTEPLTFTQGYMTLGSDWWVNTQGIDFVIYERTMK